MRLCSRNKYSHEYGCYFEIQADDLEGAIRFYGGIFGWRFSKAEGLPISVLAD
jgi:predicted enzyme related to lactoylglutathione lyase